MHEGSWGVYRSTPRGTRVMLEGRRAGLSVSRNPVLGPAGCQVSPGSPGAGPMRLGALCAVLSIVRAWPSRVGYSGAPSGRRLLASWVTMIALLPRRPRSASRWGALLPRPADQGRGRGTVALLISE